MSELSGKRALVTGGSRGIGAAIALALAQKGADVAITYERSADRAAEVVRAIEQTGRRGLAIQADSAHPASGKAAVDATVQALGGLDILVNNAGIAHQGLLEDIALADIDALLNVNVRGAVLVAQAAIPHLQEGGRIILLGSSLSERVPFGGVTMYSVTKSAQVALTRGLARELGPRGIRVNAVNPGLIETEGTRTAGALGAEFQAWNEARTPLGRIGQVRDIAPIVAFLASDDAGWVTGEFLFGSGGMR